MTRVNSKLSTMELDVSQFSITVYGTNINLRFNDAKNLKKIKMVSINYQNLSLVVHSLGTTYLPTLIQHSRHPTAKRFKT